jgi:hypothetical protein
MRKNSLLCLKVDDIAKKNSFKPPCARRDTNLQQAYAKKILISSPHLPQQIACRTGEGLERISDAKCNFMFAKWKCSAAQHIFCSPRVPHLDATSYLANPRRACGINLSHPCRGRSSCVLKKHPRNIRGRRLYQKRDTPLSGMAVCFFLPLRSLTQRSGCVSHDKLFTPFT